MAENHLELSHHHPESDTVLLSPALLGSGMSTQPILPAASSFFRAFFELRTAYPRARQCQHAVRRSHTIARSSPCGQAIIQPRFSHGSRSRHDPLSSYTSSRTLATSRHPSDDYPDVYDPTRPVEPLPRPSEEPEETDSPPQPSWYPSEKRQSTQPLPVQEQQTTTPPSQTRPPSSTSSPSSTPPSPQTNANTLSTPLRALMRLVPHPVTLITSSLPPTSSPSNPTSRPPAESSFRGATVSSFNTVTLFPTPLVSLNMKLPSSTYTALQASGGTFLAHVLAANWMGERIADAFARGNSSGGREGGVFAALVGAGSDTELLEGGAGGGANSKTGAGLTAAGGTTKMDVKVFTGPSTCGAPLVASSGVLKVLRCRALPGKEVVVGDHVVLVAAVEAILSAPGGSSNAVGKSVGRGRGNALNYVRGEGKDREGMEKVREKEVHGLVYVDGAYRSVDRGTDLVDMEAVDPDGDDVVKQESADDEPIQRTIGLNVRRGDEYA